jgi:hypothetical protein
MDPGILLTRDSIDERRSQFVRCSANLICYILKNSRYAALSKTGEADALAAQDLSLIQGLNEQEIQIAIEELKRSTGPAITAECYECTGQERQKSCTGTVLYRECSGQEMGCGERAH